MSTNYIMSGSLFEILPRINFVFKYFENWNSTSMLQFTFQRTLSTSYFNDDPNKLCQIKWKICKNAFNSLKSAMFFTWKDNGKEVLDFLGKMEKVGWNFQEIFFCQKSHSTPVVWGSFSFSCFFMFFLIFYIFVPFFRFFPFFKKIFQFPLLFPFFAILSIFCGFLNFLPHF